MSYLRNGVYYIDGEWGGRECTNCGQFRNWNEFYNKKNAFNGKISVCIKCKSKIGKSNYTSNYKWKTNNYTLTGVYYINGEWGGKTCSRCGNFRIWNEFYPSNTGFNNCMSECIYCNNDKNKIYYEENSSLIATYKNHWYKDNKSKISIQHKKYKKKLAVYKMFANYLTIEESPRETEDGFLEVKCANSNCRKYFVPTNRQVFHRIDSLIGKSTGELRLYCSEKCKHECSLYRQRKYPKGFKTKPTGTEFPKFVRDEILKRDNYKCQICGGTRRLQAHHIYPGSTHPMLSNDVNNGITLCKKCHKKVHKLPGCGLHEIASCSQRIKQDLNDKGIDPHEIPDWAVEKYMEKTS